MRCRKRSEISNGRFMETSFKLLHRIPALKAMSRYFDHGFTDAPFRIDQQKIISNITSIAARLLIDNTQDESIYTGSAGISYALLRLATNTNIPFPLPGIRLVEIWEQLLRNVRSAMYAMRQQSERRHGWSLCCGHAGVYATSAMVFHDAANGTSCMHCPSSLLVEGLPNERPSALNEEYQRALLKFQNLAVLVKSFSSKSVGFPADEVLYGKAGYLLGVKSMQHLAMLPAEHILATVKALIDSGKYQSELCQHPCPLYYEWPPGDRARPYLGMAHGLMGVLYSMMHFKDALETLEELSTVRECLEFILHQEVGRTGVRGAFGLYPNTWDSTHAPLIHWCHGSAGAVFLFAKAYEVFADDRYLQAAIRAGEVVWKRGLLMKGPGLCHGVSGNGYALLRLFRETGDEKYLTRASRFAEFMISTEFLSIARRPDHPLSLFEGWAGALCLLIDLLDPESARFPFFEI